jgi:D,D-heptose 1,7-bisphosphate phosphatase
MLVKQAVVLVGGKGTRLGELAMETPKPLLEIDGGHRFLDYLLENIARQGFSEIVLVAGHLGEQVESRYGGAKRIHDAGLCVIREPTPRGTAGALIEARHLLDPNFLMMNGDAFVDINLRAFERSAAKQKKPAVIASLRMQDSRRYGTLETFGDAVSAFREKDEAATGFGLINAGVYRLSQDCVATIDRLPASIEVDVFPQLAKLGTLGHVPVSGWFLDIGLPETLAMARAEMPIRLSRPCVFFDRDNTLTVDRGYTHKPEDLKWVAGAESLIGKLNNAGWRVVICTNQSGVARGYYTESDVELFHRAMKSSLAESGAFIDAFYYCPFHTEATLQEYRQDHFDRKPNPGMIKRATVDLKINLPKSIFIGDSETDMAAAKAAGIAGHHFKGGNIFEFASLIPELSGVIAN